MIVPFISDIISMDYYFGKTKFGNTKLIVSGHRFKLNKVVGTRRRWVCIKTKSRCTAFAITEKDTIIVIKDKHNHNL